FGRRRAVFARRLDIQPLDDAIVHDHRIALRALTHAELAAVHLEARRSGKVAITVGKHGDVFRSVSLVPRPHHEWVVDRNAGDFVDALALQLARLLDIGWKVTRGAGRREGTGNGEQRDLLALEEVGAGGGLRPVVRRNGERHVGKAVANLDGHQEVSLVALKRQIGPPYVTLKTCEARTAVPLLRRASTADLSVR